MQVYILLLSLILTGCTAFKSGNNIISIDTTPRGIKAYSGKKYLGKTPLFNRTESDEKSEYNFVYNSNKKRQKLTKKSKTYCSYYGNGKTFQFDKKETHIIDDVVTNIDPTKILLKSKRYECIEAVKLIIPAKTNTKNACKTYVVVPPENSNGKLSYSLATEWKKRNFSKGKCNKTVLPGVTESFFAFLGIDHLKSPNDISEIKYSNLMRIGEKFSATHIVFLPYTTNGDDHLVKPKVYDLHSAKLIKGSADKKYNLTFEQNAFKDFIFSNFRFIPNMLALSIKSINRLWLESDRINDYGKVYEAIQYGVSADTVQPPQYKWVFSSLIAPKAVWNNWGKDLNVETLGATMDYSVLLHNPLGGVLMARVGAGGGRLKADFKDIGYKSTNWSYLLSYGLEYYFFPADRFVIKTGYRHYFIDGSKVQNRGVKLTGESHIFMEFGFFYPELRLLTRKLL